MAAFGSLLVRLIDFETGDQLAGVVEVDRLGLDRFGTYRPAGHEAVIASDVEPLRLDFPAGPVHLIGRDGTFERSGTDRVELLAGETVRIDLCLTREIVRSFETTGLEVGDSVRWSAEAHGRRVGGQVSLIGGGDVTTNIPDGPVRFERIRNPRWPPQKRPVVAGSKAASRGSARDG